MALKHFPINTFYNTFCRFLPVFIFLMKSSLRRTPEGLQIFHWSSFIYFHSLRFYNIRLKWLLRRIYTARVMWTAVMSGLWLGLVNLDWWLGLVNFKIMTSNKTIKIKVQRSIPDGRKHSILNTVFTFIVGIMTTSDYGMKIYTDKNAV